MERFRWLGVATLLYGCAPEGELPRFGELRFKGDQFEVWAPPGHEVCEGTFDYMNQWLAGFRERLGPHRNTDAFAYFWVPDIPDVPCTVGPACAYSRSNVIYSRWIPTEHEVVHVATDARPPSLFREGAAEVFGASPIGEDFRLVPLDHLVAQDPIESFGYQTAGRFSRFLIERYGTEAYFDLYESLDGVRSREELDLGLQDTLGTSWRDLADEFEARAACSIGRWRFFDVECTQLHPTPWRNDAHWESVIDLRCSSLGIVGPDRGTMWERRAFDVDETKAVTMSVMSPDPSATATIYECDRPCFGNDPEPWTPTVGVSANAEIVLTAGRYWIDIRHSEGTDATVTVALVSN